jgi:beta-glucosidase-like glycosyl hydrolase
MTILGVLLSTACPAQSRYVDSLAAVGKVAIPMAEARTLETEIGQLLIVNVDGFGWSGPRAVSPGYESLVHDLQIGGVIPHYGSMSYERIRAANRSLATLTELPLLIAADIVKLKGSSTTGSFGDGYVGGFLGRFKGLPDPELRTLAELDAFTFAALGINVALGPTVDTSTGDPRTVDRARIVIAEQRAFGLQPVIKHFPFLPVAANLHRESPDTRIPPSDAEKRFGAFRELSADADILMTTHLYDSLVDTSLVTFSPIWNALLREKTGFNGLLMSDGLFMLKHYTDRRAFADGPAGAEVAKIDETALWALRALLAGHDMVIAEGSAAQTTRIFQGLLTVACGNTPLARQLRGRINESHARIASWKHANEATLRRTIDVPKTGIDAVLRLLPADGKPLGGFHFDAAQLDRLRPLVDSARE